MKKIIRKIVAGFCLASVMLFTSACNDELDIQQNYPYTVETLPLPKKLKKGQSVDLEFSIVCEGNYAETTYKFRYFSEANGTLKDSAGKIIPVNRFQSVASDDFVLTYTCLVEEQQQLDFVFEDNFGQRVEFTVTFASQRTDEGKGRNR